MMRPKALKSRSPSRPPPGRARAWAIGSSIFQRSSDVDHADRLAVCFDTCHVFAAGYDLRGSRGLLDVLRQFDEIVGLDRIRIFHVNDSKKELGTRVDRHNHIGEGFIGRETFETLLTIDRFRDRPKILETPESETMHPVNLGLLCEMAGSTVCPSPPAPLPASPLSP